MADTNKSRSAVYTIGEEIFNSVSHGVGILLSIAALVLLIVFSVAHGGGYRLAGALVYGISLLVLYSMSTVYHIVQNKAAKRVLRIFDHCSIFILIAGTYTPYLFMCMSGVRRWVIFGATWGITLLGVLLNAISLEKFRKFSLVCYIVMGWAIVFSIKQIVMSVALPGVVLLVAGGVVYTVGVIFYVLKKYRYMHSVWHLFVLGGSVCHYLSILLYVI